MYVCMYACMFVCMYVCIYGCKYHINSCVGVTGFRSFSTNIHLLPIQILNEHHVSESGETVSFTMFQ